MPSLKFTQRWHYSLWNIFLEWSSLVIYGSLNVDSSIYSSGALGGEIDEQGVVQAHDIGKWYTMQKQFVYPNVMHLDQSFLYVLMIHTTRKLIIPTNIIECQQNMFSNFVASD